MIKITEFDDRLFILNSLVRRKEIPEQWQKDPDYHIEFETKASRVSRVTVIVEKTDEVTVIQYEPMHNPKCSNEESLFMLKTSEHRQRPLTVTT